MSKTSKYLSILAKVMTNKRSTTKIIDNEKFDKLYYKIHADLYMDLQKSLYPYTSNIIQKTDELLESIEAIYLCPEIIGKKGLLISCNNTTSVFEICESVFFYKELSNNLKRVYTQIPIIIVDSKEESIEICNYANIRIKLSLAELEYLINESEKRKIALNRIIQFIVIKTSLVEKDVCIITDNIFSSAEKLFWRVYSHKLIYIEDENDIRNHQFDANSIIITSDEFNNIDYKEIKDIYKLTFNNVDTFIRDEVCYVLYGIYDEYMSIETQIINYYDTQIGYENIIYREIVGDMVRLGDENNDDLRGVKYYEEKRVKRLKDESQNLKRILKDIEDVIFEICKMFDDTSSTNKTIFKYTYDRFFESFFRCKDYDSSFGKKLLSTLYTYEYDDYDLISDYLRYTKGDVQKYELKNINKSEWEKAKMIIELMDPDEIPQNYLKSYIDALGDYCHTGKELYAKSLLSSNLDQIELLKESFRLGYAKAGNKLLEMYNNGNKAIGILDLANALIPEACVTLADMYMSKYKKIHRFVNLSDREFTYYKIAAANNYYPAIGKIIDIVYSSHFSSGFQISKNDRDNIKYKTIIDNGHIICQLCRYLKEKMYCYDHYNEILGIVLFTLNENLSEAMSCLTKGGSALALYCKGNMYEFGGGVSVDVDKAIKYYEASLKVGYSELTYKRLNECNKKKRENVEESNTKEYYDSSRNYSSIVVHNESYTEDDGCFAPGTRILMADNNWCRVENIKINDMVFVYDHYDGRLHKERIVANVHEITRTREFDVICMCFENDTKLEIVKSHVLYDMTDNKYVLIDSDNVKDYLNHSFAYYDNGIIVEKKLKQYSIERKDTNYYMPISKFHMNVFAENLLTMPPTVLSMHLFDINKGMKYDLSVIEKCGITRYEEISEFVSAKEFNDLPCKYLKAALILNNADLRDFQHAITLYRL